MRHVSRSTRMLPAAFAVVLAAHAGATLAAPGDFIPPGEETFSFGIGGIVNRFDTSLRLDGQTTRGSDIHLEDNSLPKSLSSLDAALTWRFFPRHRFDAQYFTAKRSGSRSYDREIDIGDNKYLLGATVNASAKSDIFNVDYRYSFVKNPGFEMGLGLGFYGGKFTYDLNVVGNGGAASAPYNKSVSTTVPLPLLLATFDWYIGPQWKIALEVAGMQAKVGDVDGHAYRVGAAAEYMFTRNFGAGVRLEYSDVGADVTKDGFKGELQWKTNSASLYAKMEF